MTPVSDPEPSRRRLHRPSGLEISAIVAALVVAPLLWSWFGLFAVGFIAGAYLLARSGVNTGRVENPNWERPDLWRNKGA